VKKRVGGKIRSIGRKRHVNEPAQHPPTAEERMSADQPSADQPTAHQPQAGVEALLVRMGSQARSSALTKSRGRART
jgi:hypothetical protein